MLKSKKANLIRLWKIEAKQTMKFQKCLLKKKRNKRAKRYSKAFQGQRETRCVPRNLGSKRNKQRYSKAF